VGKFAAVVLGAAINPFWCVIMRNFFEELPKELFECAKIEGASELRIFWQIAIPLSKASFAAISLFYAIFFWNDYFSPLMYISDMKMWPVTVWMYQMVSSFQQDQLISSSVNVGTIEEENIKATVIFISIIPIICVYPFLQKHFAQGMTMGAVKG
jgi:putative aldouronate transport system permease protein